MQQIEAMQRTAGNGVASQSKYKAYSLHNFRRIPQIQAFLSEEQMFDIEVVGSVLPFKTNSYVIDELIRWEDVPNDPIFVLTFPQKEMLLPEHYDQMASVLRSNPSREAIKEAANAIRLQLNPHPAGQLEHNVPQLYEGKLDGAQHKYKETILFFPSQGQTCHAYCSFCFRWPQFVGLDNLKFASKEVDSLIEYLRQHPEVSDVLFTGGDPLIMSAKILRAYVEPLLEAELPNLRSIRFGTKALGYWPYKFLNDKDSDELMELLGGIVERGKHLAIMSHFNHPRELGTAAVREAIGRLRSIGAEIRTQSPILQNINDNAEAWETMWREQVSLGCIPYYMFMVRDTGAQHYFGVPLERAWRIFRAAYQRVSGLSRTVRGPSMSAGPGKVEILGLSEVAGEQVFTLRFLQGRNPDWVLRPFYAKYDPKALWLDDLEPAFGEELFFFEEEEPGWIPAQRQAALTATTNGNGKGHNHAKNRTRRNGSLSSNGVFV